MGGKGSIIGTLLGAIILGATRNGLTLMNVQTFYQSPPRVSSFCWPC